MAWKHGIAKSKFTLYYPSTLSIDYLYIVTYASEDDQPHFVLN